MWCSFRIIWVTCQIWKSGKMMINSRLIWVAAFTESFGVNYPVPIDDGSVQVKYGPLSVIPTTYILDEKRNIRFYAPGYLEYEQLEEAITQLLKDR